MALHALVNSEIPTRNTLSTSWLADATCELSSHAELGDVVVQLIERSGLSLDAVGLAEPQPVDLEGRVRNVNAEAKEEYMANGSYTGLLTVASVPKLHTL